MELLTTKDVAKITKFHERTLRRWRTQGKGPGFITIGRDIRYPLEQLQAWLEKHQVCSSTAQARFHNAS